MADDATFSVQTSAGELRITFGWAGWVAIVPERTGGGAAARRIVGSRRELAELLAGFGLPDREAEDVAEAAWKRRPRDAGHEEPATEDGPRLGVWAFLAALLLVAGAIVLIVTGGEL